MLSGRGPQQHGGTFVIAEENKTRRRKPSCPKEDGEGDLEATERMTKSRRPARRQRKRFQLPHSLIALLAVTSSVPMARAQTCVSLSGSTQCRAFNASSVSTGLTSLFPFLAFVSNTPQFDQQLSQYINSTYVQTKYQQLLGCNNVTLTNTTNYYARYTTSLICNAIVQNSIRPCQLSGDTARPLCADSCAQQAISEEKIAVNPGLCGTLSNDFVNQIRADFTNCALPANSLSSSCITGEMNEPDDCGFSTNLQGLCTYCAASSPNATDSCCVGSNVDQRCPGVQLADVFPMPPINLTTTVPSTGPSATGTAAGVTGSNGISGGAIAGIVVGSVVGAILLAGLLFFCCIFIRKRRQTSQNNSVFNQPSPKRTPAAPPQMGYLNPPVTIQPAPVGRVARMSALEGTSSDEPNRGGNPVIAAGGGYTSESEALRESDDLRGGRSRPETGRRQASLSSNSIFGGGLGEHTSPESDNQFSSPDGIASGQSEQLTSFKDYYSGDDIHPGDKVATLWAYQPRASDEFELERGDMLKVVGIWDDGWATGVRITERAEDYDGKKHMAFRDSGVSSGGGRRRSDGEVGDIKAFPLVCVCLPEHWRATIEGDPGDDGTGGPPPGLI